MKSVFKREFSSAFRHIYAYIAVAVSLLLSVIVFSSNNLSYAMESIGVTVSSMTFVTVLVIPVIAMCFVPSERSSGRDEVYAYMPLEKREVASGKLLAAFSVVLISDSLLVLFPFISGFFGEADHIISYTAILGYILFQAAWLSISMFIFKAVRRRVLAFVAVYGTALALILISVFVVFVPVKAWVSLICLCVLALALGAIIWLLTRKAVIGIIFGGAALAAAIVSYIIVPSSFGALFETVICRLSPIDRFNPFIYGVFDLGAVIYYLSVAAIFVWLFVRLFAVSGERAEKRYSMSLKTPMSSAMSLLLVTVLLAVNIAGALIPRRMTAFDATLTNKATLSKEAKDFLASIDKDVTFYLLEPISRDMDYAMDAEIYNLYIDKVIASNPNFSLERVYYENNPEMYEKWGMSHENIGANSLIVESGDRFQYISIYSLLYYSNSEMGATNMSVTEYLYALRMYSSSEQYAEYLYSLLYNTSIYSYADTAICSVVEYVTADIIPMNYYLTGHGEPSADVMSSPFYDWGLPTLDLSEEDIPEDAASIFINMPESDITEEEKDALLEYLSGGGQLTFVTDEEILDMPNLYEILTSYGMSVQNKEFVNETLEGEQTDGEYDTAEFSPTVEYNNDIFGELSSTDTTAPTIKDANAITMNENARENLLLYPLLTSSQESYLGDAVDSKASYTVACAAEAPDGARVVWFTGGESYNEAYSASADLLAYALTWVTLEYTTAVPSIPPVLYSQPTPPISSGGATMITVLLCIVSAGVAVLGVVNIYKRKKA